jgi:hypothetical protein
MQMVDAALHALDGPVRQCEEPPLERAAKNPVPTLSTVTGFAIHPHKGYPPGFIGSAGVLIRLAWMSILLFRVSGSGSHELDFCLYCAFFFHVFLSFWLRLLMELLLLIFSPLLPPTAPCVHSIGARCPTPSAARLAAAHSSPVCTPRASPTPVAATPCAAAGSSPVDTPCSQALVFSR